MLTLKSSISFKIAFPYAIQYFIHVEFRITKKELYVIRKCLG